MNLALECLYCGHKWEDQSFSMHSKFRCPRCQDLSVKVRQIEKIDYYAEAKPRKAQDVKDPYIPD